MANYLDLDGLRTYDSKIKAWIKSGTVDITDDAIRALFVVGPADNEIWYTSSDGNVITPYNTEYFGANIVSNTYEDGKGVIEFDNSVTSIEEGAFSGCSTLTSVTIPNSVTSIGVGTFSECASLTSINIPNGVTSIGDQAFYNCSSLTSITIPESVTSIGNDVFLWCSSLTSITIPESVTSIGGSAFSHCSSLTSIVVNDENTKYDNRENCNAIIETSTNTLITGCQNTIIPNSVTSIEEGAFSGCSTLASITIPNSVTSIGNYAFSGCTSLTSVTIGNSVKWVGELVFSNCSYLTSITFEGTIEEWNSITKDPYWNSEASATHVQCSDGQVTL